MNAERMRELWPCSTAVAWMPSDCRRGLVSVVVPAFNRSAVVVAALDSVWSQTYRPIELVVVDDGSTDDTLARAATWALSHAGDSEFHVVLVNGVNTGAPAARNRGLKMATGEFIQFLDSDDVLHPDKIAGQVGALQADSDLDMVYSGTARFCHTLDWGASAYAGLPMPTSDILAAYLNGGLWNTISGIYRRDACQSIGPWNERLFIMQDWDYNLRFILGEPNIGYVDGVLSLARIGLEGQITLGRESEPSLRSVMEQRGEWAAWFERANRLNAQTKEPIVDVLIHVGRLALLKGYVCLAREAFQSAERLDASSMTSAGLLTYRFLARCPQWAGPPLARALRRASYVRKRLTWSSLAVTGGE